MRFRILNQIPKTLRSSISSPSQGRSAIRPSQLQMKIHQTNKTTLQQRLFSNSNNIRIARLAVGVEGCTSVMTLLVEGVTVEPNLPRGWDAGVTDDDGG